MEALTMNLSHKGTIHLIVCPSDTLGTRSFVRCFEQKRRERYRSEFHIHLFSFFSSSFSHLLPGEVRPWALSLLDSWILWRDLTVALSFCSISGNNHHHVFVPCPLLTTSLITTRLLSRKLREREK